MQIKIGELADIHLGAGTAFGVLNPATGLNTFTERQVEACMYAIQVMCSQACKHLVIAGDIFNHPDPSSALIIAFQSILDFAAFKGMKVILITGNHDKSDDTSNAVQALYRTTDDWIYYVGHGDDVVLDGVRYRLQDAEFVRDGNVNVGLYHGIIPGCTAGHVSLTRDGFKISPNVDFVLAGDVHQAQTVEFDHRRCFYPGSPTRLNFGEKDYTPGFGIATVSSFADAVNVQYEHLSTKHLSLDFIEVDQPQFLSPKADAVYKVSGPSHLRESVASSIAAAGGVMYKYVINDPISGVAELAVGRDDMNVSAIVDSLDVEQVVKDYLRRFIRTTASTDLKGDYRLESLEMRNFGPFLDEKITFSPEDQSYLVCGSVNGATDDSNGAGKSFIFDAIKCCLVGTTYRGLQAGWAVNDRTGFLALTLRGQKELRVERTITRGAGNGSHDIKVFLDGVEQTKDRTRETQSLIQDLMGVSEQSFDVSTLIGVEGLSLVDRGSAWRVDYLIDLFNMGGIDLASDDINEQIRTSAAILTSATTVLQSQSQQLGALQSQAPELPNLFELLAYRDERDKFASEVADIQAKINNAHELVASAVMNNSHLSDSVDNHQLTVTRARSAVVSAEVVHSSARNRHAQALAAVDANKCPTCHQAISTSMAANHVMELAQAVMAAQDSEELAVKALKEAEDGLRLAMEKKTVDWQLDSVDDSALVAERSKSEANRLYYEAKVKELDARREAFGRHEAVMAAADAQLRLSEAEFAVAQAETVKWAYIQSKFNAASVKEQLVRSVSATLNGKATSYLSRIFGKAVSVRFDASLQVTKTKSIPKFDIFVERGGERVPFEQYSKGERGAVRVAVDLAVSDLVAQVNPVRFKFLILDEATDGLSPAKSAAIAELVQDLVPTRGAVMFVAHKMVLATKFGATLRVSKTDEYSTITQQ